MTCYVDVVDRFDIRNVGDKNITILATNVTNVTNNFKLMMSYLKFGKSKLAFTLVSVKMIVTVFHSSVYFICF